MSPGVALDVQADAMAKTLKTLLTSQLQTELEGHERLRRARPGPDDGREREAFRRDLREKAGGARLRVIQNRTARHALEAAWLGGENETLRKMLRGSTAIVFGGGGPVPHRQGRRRSGARRRRRVLVKGAVADGEVLDAKDAERLATLPGLPDAARHDGRPARGRRPRPRRHASTASISGLVRVLQAHVDKAPAEAAAPRLPRRLPPRRLR